MPKELIFSNMELETLIIDDDKIVCYLHERLLKKTGFLNVTFFTDSREALKYVTNSINKKFILFLDLNMPLLGGWEFLDRLSDGNFENKLTVYIVSSSIDERDHNKANNYNVVEAFLEKPLTYEKVEFIKSKYLHISSRYEIKQIRIN